jgi:hypothetical protein
MPSCSAELGSKPLRYSKPGGRRRVKSASWVQWLDEEHPTGSEMLTAIFMNSYWKDDVRHWRSVEAHAHCVDALFEALPPAAVVFDSYLRFLYHIGERSLPRRSSGSRLRFSAGTRLPCWPAATLCSC